MSYCEIIRGEVSIFRGGAGGLSYVSSGSVRDSLCGGSRAEAVASPDSETKQIKKLVFDTIKHLKLKKLKKLKKIDRISERTRGVHQIFSTQNRPRSSWSTRGGFRSQLSVDSRELRE